jgi:hypothetical protein
MLIVDTALVIAFIAGAIIAYQQRYIFVSGALLGYVIASLIHGFRLGWTLRQHKEKLAEFIYEFVTNALSDREFAKDIMHPYDKDNPTVEQQEIYFRVRKKLQSLSITDL